MAVGWGDSFSKHGGNTARMLNGLYANVGALWSISTANPTLPGGSHLRFNANGGATDQSINSGSSFRRIFGAPKTLIGVAYHIYCPDLPNDEAADGAYNTAFNLAAILNAAGLGQCSFVLGTDGAVVAYSGFQPGPFGSVTLLDRSAPCITARSYNHFEVKAVPNAVTGSFEVRVNNATVLNITGSSGSPLNTDPCGTGELSQLLVGNGQNIGLGMGNVDIADLHHWDDNAGNGPTDFVGNASIAFNPMTADTAHADWAKSTGSSGYPLLGDSSDATYIEANATGQKSAFARGALPTITQGVVWQGMAARMLKSDIGDCAVTPSFISTGGGETAGAAVPITTAPLWYENYLAIDPDTTAPYTPAGAAASTPALLRST